MTTIVREPKHRCNPGYPIGGEIVRCDRCGRYWRGVTYPNPKFDKWVRVGWIGRKLRGLP